MDLYTNCFQNDMFRDLCCVIICIIIYIIKMTFYLFTFCLGNNIHFKLNINEQYSRYSNTTVLSRACLIDSAQNLSLVESAVRLTVNKDLILIFCLNTNVFCCW